MEINRHHDLIAQHSINVKAQLPAGVGGQLSKGAYGKRRDSRGMKGFYNPSNCRRSKVTTHVGIGLVRWFLANDMKEEARDLLTAIKTGKVPAY